MSAMRAVVYPEPEEECWLAVQTRYRFEKKVAQELSDKGMKVFLPLRTENRAWCDRSRVVQIPLFPGNTFVQAAPCLVLRVQVLQTPGVLGFASAGGAMAVVPAKQIEDLRRVLVRDVQLEMCPFVAFGKRVRVRTGSLEGLEGVVAPRDPGKLVISVAAIQRSVAIEIEDHQWELV